MTNKQKLDNYLFTGAFEWQGIKKYHYRVNEKTARALAPSEGQEWGGGCVIKCEAFPISADVSARLRQDLTRNELILDVMIECKIITP